MSNNDENSYENIEAMTTEKRMQILEKIIEIESEKLFQQAKDFADMYRSEKKIEEEGLQESQRGLHSISVKKNSNGLGFEFRWLKLERFYRKKTKQRAEIKVFKKGKFNRYKLKSVLYPGITQWEKDVFESIEDQIEPIRYLVKALGRISKAKNEYVNKVNARRVIL